MTEMERQLHDALHAYGGQVRPERPMPPFGDEDAGGRRALGRRPLLVAAAAALAVVVGAALVTSTAGDDGVAITAGEGPGPPMILDPEAVPDGLVPLQAGPVPGPNGDILVVGDPALDDPLTGGPAAVVLASPARSEPDPLPGDPERIGGRDVYFADVGARTGTHASWTEETEAGWRPVTVVGHDLPATQLRTLIAAIHVPARGRPSIDDTAPLEIVLEASPAATEAQQVSYFSDFADQFEQGPMTLAEAGFMSISLHVARLDQPTIDAQRALFRLGTGVTVDGRPGWAGSAGEPERTEGSVIMPGSWTAMVAWILADGRLAMLHVSDMGEDPMPVGELVALAEMVRPATDEEWERLQAEAQTNSERVRNFTIPSMEM